MKSHALPLCVPVGSPSSGQHGSFPVQVALEAPVPDLHVARERAAWRGVLSAPPAGAAAPGLARGTEPTVVLLVSGVTGLTLPSQRQRFCFSRCSGIRASCEPSALAVGPSERQRGGRISVSSRPAVSRV